MPTTPIRAFPYPAPSATPDVPFDMQNLAEKVETVLTGFPSKFAFAGPVTLSFNASGEATITHNLGVAPKYVAVTQDAGTASSQILIQPKITTATTTTITVVAQNVSTGAAHTSSLTARWVAMA